MTSEPVVNLLPLLSSRQDYFDYLDRWTSGTVRDLQEHMTKRALVKAFLLETSQSNGSRDAVISLENSGQVVTKVDDGLFRLRLPNEPSDWALVEVEDQRYPVLYTALKSEDALSRQSLLLQSSSLLDNAWFASAMFQRLWQLVREAYPSFRYSQIVFEHESVFEEPDEVLSLSLSSGTEVLTRFNDSQDTEEVNEETNQNADAIRIAPERRRAILRITERIGRLDDALNHMRPYYDPLESIVRLRVPAPGKGGHDVYFDGRFVNRSDSITSLRQTIEDVKRIYRHSTQAAEKAAWPSSLESNAPAQPISMGAPLYVKFSQPLSLKSFERWIASLRQRNNRFRLWGTPIQRGPNKIHMYAVDNHLWQPIDLEITTDHLYALLPAGTCGNTIHRLVTNIQRFIDPKLETFIGDQPYESFMERAPIYGGTKKLNA